MSCEYLSEEYKEKYRGWKDDGLEERLELLHFSDSLTSETEKQRDLD